MFETHISSLLELHYARDGGGEAIPVGGLFFKFFAAETRRAVELGATIVLAGFSLHSNSAFLLQLAQGRVERHIADLQDIARNLFQPLPEWSGSNARIFRISRPSAPWTSLSVRSYILSWLPRRV